MKIALTAIALTLTAGVAMADREIYKTSKNNMDYGNVVEKAVMPGALGFNNTNTSRDIASATMPTMADMGAIKPAAGASTQTKSVIMHSFDKYGN